MRPRLIMPAFGVALALGAVGWVRGHAGSRPSSVSGKQGQLVVTTTARRQDLLLTVSQTGVVEAKHSTPLVPDISGRIQWVCENGVIVKAGDTILRLDPTQLQEQLDDLTARHQDAQRRQAQAEIAGAAQMKEMRLRLRRAQDDVTAFQRQQEVALRQAADRIEFHKQELVHQREDADVQRRLAAKGLVAATEVERADTAVKAAEFALQREQSDYELQKSQVDADTSQRRRNVNNTTRDMSRARTWSERETRMSGNEVENLDLQLARAREDLGKATLVAPVSGLVVLSNQGGWRGESRPPRLGDWVSQGREVAGIVNLARLEVKLELDQAQITGIKMGQAAQVTIEALPDKPLQGKVVAIGQTARRPPVQGWMGMSSAATFPVTVELPPTGKALIRPGMRATATMVVRHAANAIVVPSGCIFVRDGRSLVFAERNGIFTPVTVVTGLSNGDYTAIARGLAAGERIALNDLGAPASGASQPAPSKAGPKEPHL